MKKADCCRYSEDGINRSGIFNKQNLSLPRKHLVEIMQLLDFGYIERLVIKDGEPVFDPPPRVVRKVKFCRENGPRPETAKQDFALKASVCDLFAQFEALGNGIFQSIEVNHGLPFMMLFEENAAWVKG